ncbi:hypothetical protein [Burkholderia cepacia]|uniref:hypothetical protein n=1 Tax=Burkholderia cepacia TaxID=292 RepID=UPI002AB73452|nr:hypothetical protein [Burkholderia cepacia]
MTSLPKKNKIQTPRKHVRPLQTPTQLNFTLWNLAHAVKKAEYVTPLLPGALSQSSSGFLLENASLFDWSGGNFRLADGALAALDDFSHSGLMGRLGQGFALLKMQNFNFSFVSRFKKFCATASPPVSTTTTKNGRIISLRTPDMVFERADGTQALAESKGSGVHPGTLPDIKSALLDGLGQLGNWGAAFNPSIGKGYAMSAFLREKSDPHPENSILAFVDPEGKVGNHVPRRNEIVAQNYGLWLHGMNYPEIAGKLLGVREGNNQYSFQLAEIGGESFAVTFHAPVFDTRYRYFIGWIATGIRWKTLSSLSTWSKNSTDLSSRNRLNIIEPISEFDGSYGSVFPDGTYFGMVKAGYFPEDVLTF